MDSQHTANIILQSDSVIRMSNNNDFNKKFAAYAKKFKKFKPEFEKIVEDCAKKACDNAVKKAKELSPHADDGKIRGMNVISNRLYNSWFCEYVKKDYGKIGNIKLYNTAPYFNYVQFGHKVKRHFVPWLYIDELGRLSYETNHNKKMIGLIVGTKTSYVEGVDMISPAIKIFEESFEKELSECLEKIKF